MSGCQTTDVSACVLKRGRFNDDAVTTTRCSSIICLALSCSITLCSMRSAKSCRVNRHSVASVVHMDPVGLGRLRMCVGRRLADALFGCLLCRGRSDAMGYRSVGSISWGVFDVLSFVEIPLGCG